MDSSASIRSSGGNGAARNSMARCGAAACMSEQQAQAYLLARDVLRRVKAGYRDRRHSHGAGHPPWLTGYSLLFPRGDVK
jgi:hypothetical protein